MGLFRNLWRGRKPERREPVSRDYEREYDDQRGQDRDQAPEQRSPRARPARREGNDYAQPRERPAYGYAGEDGAALYRGYDPNDEPPRPPRRAPPRWEENDPAALHDRHRLAEDERGYRGRGPRNYRRSDERIREDICDRLTEDALLDASDIEVTVKSGEAMLDGAVSDKLARRRAEDIADSVSGVVVVVNNLRIERHARTGAMAGDTPNGRP